MNINDLAVSETATIELRHPATNEVLTTDDGKPMTATIFSKYTRKYKAAFGKFQSAQIKVLADAKDGEALTEDQEALIEQAGNELITACTKAVLVQIDGKNVKDPGAIIGKPEYAFLQEQIDNAIMRPGVFMNAQ